MLSRLIRFFFGRQQQFPTKTASSPPQQGAWALGLLVGTQTSADTPPLPPDDVRIWIPILHDGSSEHYYHFLLGLVMPLLLDGDTRKGVKTLVRSCGPLDSILTELNLPAVVILPKVQWTQLKNAGAHRHQSALGYDAPEFYDREIFMRFRQAAFERLDMPEPVPDAGVLIINRGDSPAFYQSDAVDNPTSANLRRSVPNMAAIRDRLLARGTPCLLRELENASLRDQLETFGGANILVAQHGAALANMIWMKPGGRVIEIMPEVGKFAAYFEQLASICGHEYAVIKQETRHAAVDVRTVVNLVSGEAAG